jgi:hypothetical protein
MPAETRLQERRTYLREGLLLAGFLLVVIAGVVTVVVPELSKTPDDDRPGAPTSSERAPAAVAGPSK